MRKVYLDHAATTPVAADVQKAMRPYYDKIFGNPMAMHSFGAQARQAVEETREAVAAFFNFEPEEIVFTSGATESNNLALKGVVKAVKKKYDITPHIITTAFEHHCMLDSAKDLLKSEARLRSNELRRGEAEVTFIKPAHDGMIKTQEILAAIKPNTVLVSIMYVNNEVGTIAPLAEIAEIIKKEKIKRESRGDKSGGAAVPIYFMSDITQGVNYLPCDMVKMGVDLFSMSGHKIYGPKGVGALGVRKGVLIEKIQLGGEQEYNLRAGTHNVPGIVGLGAATKRITNYQLPITKRIRSLRDYFWKKLQKEVMDIRLNGSLEKRVANNLNVSFAGVEGESMLLALDMAGIACSTGSACSSESLEPSHVLMSMGLTHPEAHSSLRFTLGEGNTRADIDYATLQIKKVVEKLRRVSGYKR